ncbi:MAG: L,D-transpeptidase family protein [Eubacteriales bacterium]|nr:L,D-transpeptidase family protein [Eubacteriales bacterium]
MKEITLADLTEEEPQGRAKGQPPLSEHGESPSDTAPPPSSRRARKKAEKASRRREKRRLKRMEQQTNSSSEESLHRKKYFPWGRAVLLPAGILAALCAVLYVGGMIYFQDKFLPNTTINGTDASGCTVEEIEARLAKNAEKYHIELAERGGEREYIDAADIDYHYVSRNEVELFKVEQGAFEWPVSFFKTYDYSFDSSTAYDPEKLKEVLLNLKCMQDMEAPEDARIEFKGGTYQLIREKEGDLIDFERLEYIIKKVIQAGAAGVSLEAQGCYAEPNVTSEDPYLKNLYQNLKHYTDTRVEYTFGDESEILDGNTIKEWLTADEEGNVTVDQEAVAQYVAELAARHDTYNKTKEFKATDGTYIQVSGGSFGWMIDQAAEIENLNNDLKNSQQEIRDPAYAQTALSFDNCGMGDSYVEVDLTKQHLWMYVDGRLLLDTDFVSGDIAKNHATPAGIYTIYYKKSPDVLKSDTPGDSYETPVNYWMPFNGGIGFHDATWRGSFGGSIYQNGGSHGCINMPLDQAALMYENIYAGFPVVCFYR